MTVLQILSQFVYRGYISFLLKIFVFPAVNIDLLFSHLLLFYFCVCCFFFFPKALTDLSSTYQQFFQVITYSSKPPFSSFDLTSANSILHCGPINYHEWCMGAALKFPITVCLLNSLIFWLYIFLCFALLSSFWRTTYSCVFLKLCIQSVKFLSLGMFGNFFILPLYFIADLAICRLWVENHFL